TPGSNSIQAETLPMVSGDAYGIYISTAGSGCNADQFAISAAVACPGVVGATGATGPTGPAGPMGATGATGPAGGETFIDVSSPGTSACGTAAETTLYTKSI